MFNEAITQTPFHSSAADTFFSRLPRADYNGDLSLSATVRALIFPRMGPYDTLGISFQSIRYNMEENAGLSDKFISRSVLGRVYSGTDTLTVCDVFTTRSVSGGRDFFDAVKDGIPALGGEYVRVPGIHDLFRKAFPIECFVDTVKRRTLVFVERLNLRKLHTLQHGIFAMLPWYCTKERGMTAEERELLFSLKEPSPDRYLACLDKMVSAYDFRSEAIRSMLSGFERLVYEDEAKKCRRKVLEKEDLIKDLNRRVTEENRLRNEILMRQLGLEVAAKEKDENNELMNYFLQNKTLYLVKAEGGYITFAVRRYLDYFDPDAVRCILENKDSVVYTLPCFRADDREGRIKRLMEELFLSDNPRMRIRFCAGYRLKIGEGVIGLDNFCFPKEIEGCMPNPHIRYHACLGDYNSIINECVANGNYVSAVEQCAASCASLNWLDNVVLKEFIRDLWAFDNMIRCIELPDGNVVNALEASDWLEQQDKEEESV